MIKTITTTIIAIVFFFTTLSTPALAYPDFPWPNGTFPVGNNQSRHHIVPGNQMMNDCVQLFHSANNQNRLNFLEDIPNINQAIISYQNLNDLVDGYDQGHLDAQNDIQALCAWLPGNLVIGPINQLRNNDPGQAFDNAALNCRIASGIAPLDIYQNFEADWNAGQYRRTCLINELRGIRPETVVQGTQGHGQNCNW